MSKQHTAALTMLKYGLMHQAGFTVITGGIGSGKTTLIRYLIDRLKGDVTVGLVTNTQDSFGELLQWVLLAFGLEHSGKEKVQYYKIFMDFIQSENQQNRRTLLIFDEAQNLSMASLEELRMLSNLNAGKQQLLQLILAGQHQLLDTLHRPQLYQFAQRVTADYYIAPMDQMETRAYVHHRLSVAGGEPSIFTDGACDAVYRYAKGVPRLINIICDSALVYGFAAQAKSIPPDIIHDVVRDKVQGRRVWRHRKASPVARGANLEVVHESPGGNQG
jgi:type II secretory pathway predicted ATPase ExeA